ncbi:S-adenosyl-L-methionine-dependent methyltransferases superfamily protein [Actinidia rufa]|uniref:S-adenosyl-L-methionine-dependent methyltransferases superfamily protein n=1 Tax=Actinidia rufa TaxID=165716 RepID=A0A7J0HE82_9ERIC|nr:S-adenosyl-L-methionine-dependent methyltransferases superfamily protein [Actinidia rufa]
MISTPFFSSLPPGRHYFAAGVPGSFHGRLFPKSSLHFAHSSYALHWLSKVPEDLLDKSSPAWNKGRIHCKNASEQVANAYANQFAKDMEVFLDARADEIAVGGMMVVIMPAHPEGDRPSQSMARVARDFIEQSFVDMVKVGSISEAELDSFNLPLYSPSLKEMTQLVQSNGCFSIESMELTDPLSKIVCPLNIRALVMHLRAALEGIFTKHFGSEIIDELFERTLDKFAEFSSRFESCCGQQDTQLFFGFEAQVIRVQRVWSLPSYQGNLLEVLYFLISRGNAQRTWVDNERAIIVMEVKNKLVSVIRIKTALKKFHANPFSRYSMLEGSNGPLILSMDLITLLAGATPLDESGDVL